MRTLPWLINGLLVVFSWWREKKDSTVITSSKSNYLPRAPPSYTIAMRVRVSTYEFGKM